MIRQKWCVECLAAVFTVAMLLVGCGSDGDSGNGNGGYTGQATFDYKGLDAALSGINCQYFDLQEVEAYQVIYVD